MSNKKYYTVEIECTVPVVIKARVLVDEDDWDKAISETEKKGPIVSIKRNSLKKKYLKILDAGYIKYSKTY